MSVFHTVLLFAPTPGAAPSQIRDGERGGYEGGVGEQAFAGPCFRSVHAEAAGVKTHRPHTCLPGAPPFEEHGSQAHACGPLGRPRVQA